MLWYLRVFAVVYAAYQAYSYRFRLFQDDGLQYLDMADLALQGMPEHLINSIWSPLYPILELIVMAVFRPAPVDEMPMMRALNFFIFIAVMVAFEFFLKQFIRYRESLSLPENLLCISNEKLKVCAYLLFISISFVFYGIYHDTPDQLVNLFVLLAFTQLLRIKKDPKSKLNVVLLGLVCGLGFIAKQVFMTFTAIFVLTNFVLSREQRWKNALIVVSVFLCFYLPFVLAVSFKLGRFTLTEAGKMSYIQTVSKVYDSHWPQGEELVRPVRKIFDKPVTYEFSAEPFSTYPNFLERSYWMEGYKFAFSFEKSLKIGIESLFAYVKNFGAVLLLSFLLAALCARAWPVSLSSMKPYWFLFFWSTVVLFMYAAVSSTSWAFQTRYYGAAVLVLLIAYMASMAVPRKKGAQLALNLAVVILMTPYVARIGWQGYIDSNALQIFDKPEDWLIVQDLYQLGIKPGDKVAHLGYYTSPFVIERDNLRIQVTTGYYWARLARIQIAADIISTKDFNELSDERKQLLIDKLKSCGIRAIVLFRTQSATDSEKFKWQKLPRSGRKVLLLSDSSAS